MAKVLVLKGSPKGEASFSGKTVDAFVQSYRESHPQDEVEVLELFRMQFPIITQEILDHWDGKEQEHRPEFDMLDGLCKQFSQADKYIISSSHWNGMVNPCIVHYMVCVLRAGVAFYYDKQGCHGMLGGKRVQIVLSSGGICENAVPTVRCYGEDWLRGVLGHCGMEDIRTLFVQGMEEFPEKEQEILQNAVVRAKELAKEF